MKEKFESYNLEFVSFTITDQDAGDEIEAAIKNESVNLVYVLVRHKFSISFIKEVNDKLQVILKNGRFNKVHSSVPIYRKIVFFMVSLMCRFL